MPGKLNGMIAALTGNDVSADQKNTRAHMSQLSVLSSENGNLHEVGMHAVSRMEDVGIHPGIRIPRPRNHQLGTYLSKGYKPFVDVLSGKYFLIRREEPSVLLYNSGTRNFDSVGPESLLVED